MIIYILVQENVNLNQAKTTKFLGVVECRPID